jgi:hypothetical protein
MPQDLPIVCSLAAGNLEQRLATIGEIGAESLIDHESNGGMHMLRFRAGPRTRERLEGVIEAEAQCCAFLDLSLEEEGDHLVLSVAAPEAGKATADGFAMAFAGDRYR